jgi:hypothetical protein
MSNNSRWVSCTLPFSTVTLKTATGGLVHAFESRKTT